MKRKKYLCLIFIGIVIAYGCSLISGYGKLRQQNKKVDGITIQHLQDTWEEYNIYYAGYYGSLSIKHPSAIVFDLRNDDRKLGGDKWTIVSDKQTLLELIDSIQRQESLEGLNPDLWKIYGPDEKFYGYFYSAWRHLVVKVVDEKTMEMFDLPLPPYLAEDDNGEMRTGTGK